MKFSIYNNIIEKQDYWILYNTKVAKYIKFTPSEEFDELKKMLETNKFKPEHKVTKVLSELGFIVEENINEYQEQKQKITEYFDKKSRFLKIVLYITDQCNFRCVYCPEEHITRVLPENKWNSLYKLIEKGLKENKYDNIMIMFFGGEPLLETKKIINFLEKLKCLKEIYPSVKMQHAMVTNGYLLTSKSYDKLTKLDLKSYQITIDGFKDTHNKLRPRVDGAGTWDTIIKNLKYINTQKDDVKICFRTNVNNENIEQLEDFRIWFNQNFDQNKFIFDVQKVLEYTEKVDKNYIFEENQKNNESCVKANKNDENNDKHPLQFLSKAANCSWENSFTINTKGEITKCNNLSGDLDESIIAYLNDEGEIIYNNNAKDWIEEYEYESCKTCSIYPLCAGRTCPHKKVISKNERIDCIIAKKAILEEIEMWLT